VGGHVSDGEADVTKIIVGNEPPKFRIFPNMKAPNYPV